MKKLLAIFGLFGKTARLIKKLLIISFLAGFVFLFIKSPYFSMVEKDGNYLIDTFGYTITILRNK